MRVQRGGPHQQVRNDRSIDRKAERDLPFPAALGCVIPREIRAVSSAVERLVYTEDVGGSIPSPPTIGRLQSIQCALAASSLVGAISSTLRLLLHGRRGLRHQPLHEGAYLRPVVGDG
jgi:hypothetical protein